MRLCSLAKMLFLNAVLFAIVLLLISFLGHADGSEPDAKTKVQIGYGLNKAKPAACTCPLGGDCTCGQNCQCLSVEPTAEYTRIRAVACSQQRPLLIWIGAIKSEMISDAINYQCENFYGKRGPAVIVSVYSFGEKDLKIAGTFDGEKPCIECIVQALRTMDPGIETRETSYYDPSQPFSALSCPSCPGGRCSTAAPGNASCANGSCGSSYPGSTYQTCNGGCQAGNGVRGCGTSGRRCLGGFFGRFHRSR